MPSSEDFFANLIINSSEDGRVLNGWAGTGNGVTREAKHDGLVMSWILAQHLEWHSARCPLCFTLPSFLLAKPAVLLDLNSFKIPYVHFWMLYLVFYLSLTPAFELLFFGHFI